MPQFSSLLVLQRGGIFPLDGDDLAPEAYKWYAVILAVVLTSALTGYISSKLGNGLVKIAVIRNHHRADHDHDSLWCW